MADTDGDSRYHLPPVRDGKPEVLTEQRKKRGDVVTVESDRGGVGRMSLTRPLELYVAKGQITGKQYKAGLRLNELWEKSAQSSFVQVQYRDQEGREKATSFAPPGFAAVEYRAALASIRDPSARELAHSVCCQDLFATRCLPDDMARRTAERRGMLMLRQALDELVAHFKKPVARVAEQG